MKESMNFPKIDPDLKKRVPAMVREEVIDRARDVAYWDRTTLSAIVEEALIEFIRKRENDRGEPYPKRKAQLSPGRPLK
jgi:hypothetical protein